LKFKAEELAMDILSDKPVNINGIEGLNTFWFTPNSDPNIKLTSKLIFDEWLLNEEYTNESGELISKLYQHSSCVFLTIILLKKIQYIYIERENCYTISFHFRISI